MKYAFEKTTVCLVQTLILLGIFPIVVQAQPATSADLAPQVAKARSLLYTNRELSIHILTEVTAASPHDVDAWATLVEALHLNSDDRFADRASRRALEFNPHTPELLVARARILEPGPALDVLAELEKLPNQQAYAHELGQFITLSMTIPDKFDNPAIFGGWAERLLASNLPDDAERIVERGLKLQPTHDDPNNSRLLALKAMALALREKFDESMVAYDASGRTLVTVDGVWAGLPDILLSKGRADLAILSSKDIAFDRLIAEQAHAFGGPHTDYGSLKRVLAWSYVIQGQSDRALSLLTAPTVLDQLLVMEIYHREEQDEKAKEVIRAFMTQQGPGGGQGGGGGFYPFFSYFHGAESLEDVYRKCARDLIGLFPERRDEFRSYYGDPDTRSERHFGFRTDIEPSSQHIPKLVAMLAAAKSPRELNTCRRNLREAYTSAGLFGEAKAVAAQGVIDFTDDESGPNLLAEAMQWALLTHRINAEELNRSNPEKLIRSRELLLSIKYYGLNTSGIEGIDTLPADEAVKALISLGPGILESVIDAFQLDTITATNRTPLVAIIRKLGDERDVPILVYTMMIMAQHLDEPEANFRENQAATLQSIDAALQSLARLEGPAGTNRDRAQFWINWWRKNAVRIVNAGPTSQPDAK